MAPIHSEATHNNSSHCIKKTVCEDGMTVRARYFCTLCSGSVSRKADFQRHMRKHTRRGLIYCNERGCTRKKGFTQVGNLKSHIRAVHLRQRYRCPDMCVGADGKKFLCDHSYSDKSGLLRHRKRVHGFVVKQVKMKTQGSASSQQVGGGGASHSNTAGPSSTVPALASASSTPVREQRTDWSSLYTLSAARPSEARPATVPHSSLGLIFHANHQLQLQPPAAVNPAPLVPLAFPYIAPSTTQTGNLEASFNPEPQTVVVNNWTSSSRISELDFSFPQSALPRPAANGTINPNTLMAPAITVRPTLEQANFANAGLGSSPGFFDPSQVQGMDFDSDPSLYESSVSPELRRLFADMPPLGAPYTVFKEYYGF